MLLRTLINRVSAVVVALVAMIAINAEASKPKDAQLGIVWVDGSLTSGSDLNYRFNLSTTSEGSLTVKASIRAKHWKATFPLLTLTPAVGVSEGVLGTAVQVPADFTGDATVRVKAYFNDKRIGSQAFLISITAPLPPAPLTVTTNLYDVGFENSVTLDGSIVPTSGLTGPLTYAWNQTSGKPVALSANNVAAPSFTTDALTNFVTLGTAIFLTDIDEDGITNLIYVTREDRFANNNVNSIALDAQHVAESTYGFRLLVSNSSVTRTGLFTVACSFQTPAQPNIPVGVAAFYRGATNSVNWSLVNRPTGSTASLNHTNGLIPELRPDVEGPYVILDNVTGKTVTNVAASFAGYQFCAICHGPGNNVNQEDKVSLWSQTAHASMAQRGIDGALSPYYSEACFQCHTVGNNKAPTANNGGFDDVAKTLGWSFPSVLQPGNFAAMPAELQAKANIQCESCHGPGSQHPGSPSVTTDVRVCASCHQDGERHFRPQQWEISPHSGGFETISVAGRGTNPQCARCHSPIGYKEIAKGNANVGTTNSVPTGAGPLTCQVCHNPHDKFGNPDRKQLRIYDTALLGNPYFRSNDVTIALGETITTADLRLTNSNLYVTGLGNAATCITCHNGRQLPTQVQLYGANKGKMFYQTGGPHDQLAGEAFLGVGMFDYGQEMGNSFHTYLAKCQTCHMYQLRAPVAGVAQDAIVIDDVETPVTQSVYNQFANLLGNHTFKMNYEYADSEGEHEADNIAACNQCHASFERVDSFDFKAVFGHDYDGNGVVEGVQTETKGVLANLAYLLMWGNGGTNGIWATTNTTAEIAVPLTLVTNKVDGVTNSVVSATGTSLVSGFSTAVGYYSTNAAVAEAQRKAVWNWLAAYREGSFGVHNTQYSIRLLQTTYTDLSTNYFGDASKTYQNDFPDAFLR